MHHPDNQSLQRVSGDSDAVSKFNQYVVYANGCPAITPITLDGQEWWHQSTIQRAGGWLHILEKTNIGLEASE